VLGNRATPINLAKQPSGSTKNVLHHADQAQGSGITYTVIDPVGILARGQNPLIAKYRKMLGDIALGCANIFDNTLNTDLLVTQCAQNFEPQWMRHGLERSRCTLDVFIAGQKLGGIAGQNGIESHGFITNY